MRLTLTVAVPASGARVDVVVEADAALTVGDVLPGLAALATVPGRVLTFPGSRSQRAGGRDPAGPGIQAYVDGHALEPRLPLARSPVREGCVISIGDPVGCLPPEPAGLVEIRVAGGPDAGGVHRLTHGYAGIGSGPAAHIRIEDPRLPGDAVGVTVDTRGRVEVVPHDGVPLLLDRQPLTGPARWQPGTQLTVGSSLLELAAYEPPDAALQRSADGAGYDFNRPPRLLPPAGQARFKLPAAPGKQERRPLPILLTVVPALMGIGMWVATRSAYMLMFVALTPVMMLGQYVSDRREGGRAFARQSRGYAEHKARIEQDARAALAAERAQVRDACPDPATVLTIASGPRRRLWERRRDAPGYLLLRVGTADLPSTVVLEDPARDEHRREVTWEIADAPVTVPLRERGVLGVAGPAGAPRQLCRWLAAQAVTLHSPSDLRLYVLTDASGERDWDWVRWVPHARPAEGQNAGVLIGTDAETVAARVAELTAMVAARQQAALGGPGERAAGPDTVVVLDGSRRLRSMPGVIQLLREGPPAGVYAICLDAEERLLPAECQAVVVAGPDGLRVQQMGSPVVERARPDLVSTGWCNRLARGIAPIRDVSHDEEDAGLPGACRLLQVLGLDPPTPDAVAARWLAGGNSTVAIVGESLDGPFSIDIRRDGPHGLIAGTTGSGKSELLQTIVASLASANRPDEMTFVLVDYKGGSAFSDCVRLPHTVGMVTDLDAHLVERALRSLNAELTRREHILAAAGARDIEEYAGARRSGGNLVPMPRLVLVIDEFASMVRDLPDFVTGLVNIAQRGRSLGIHLILATQRPSGVVSADIRANTNLRIALRVTDPAESADVIGAPDAAHISRATPGRAYVRLGAASLVPFQSGRVGGRRPGAATADGARPWLAPLEWAQLGRPPLTRPSGPAAGAAEVTDLTVLVAAAAAAARQLRVPAPHRPWLDPLPASLLVADLAAPATGAERCPADEGGAPVDGGPGGHGTSEDGTGQDARLLPAVPYARDDLPSAQAQRAASIRFSSFGHLLAAGAPRSGRSQLLRTIAGSVARLVSCGDVHLYGIDCGNGALLALTSLPHCGAVVTRTEGERATRLLSRLVREVALRQELLALGGFASITEQRLAVAPEERLPHILVLLDRWEGFLTSLGEIAGGEPTDQVYKLLSEGASAGVHLVVTGDQRVISGRLSGMTEDKLAFRLADKGDFAAIGLSPRTVPAVMPPGRALHAETGIETQVALLAPDDSGQGQAAALAAIGQEAVRRDGKVPRQRRPFRVDVLPASITFADAWSVRDPAAAGNPLFGLAGVGGDELTGYGPDLTSGMAAFIIAGPRRSGRSSALVAMARSFLAGGAEVILVAPRPSPLRDLAGQPGVVALFGSADLTGADLATALAALAGPGVVLADDAELLRDCDAGDDLAALMSLGAQQRRALVLAGDAADLCAGFGNWQVEAKKARRGVLLSPQDITDADLIGTRVPRGAIGRPVRPGRGLLHLGDGALRTIQVPFG